MQCIDMTRANNVTAPCSSTPVLLVAHALFVVLLSMSSSLFCESSFVVVEHIPSRIATAASLPHSCHESTTVQRSARNKNDSRRGFFLDIAKRGAVGAAITITSQPARADADVGVIQKIEAGEQLFASNCAGCHRGGKNIIAKAKTLEWDALELYLNGGPSQEAVQTIISQGKSAMPSFGKRLNDEEIETVAAYVLAKSEAGWN